MNILLCVGAGRSECLKDYLQTRCDRLLETTEAVDLGLLHAEGVDWIISNGYGLLFSGPVLAAYRGRIINLHGAYLPWGRGSMGNLWSHFDDTPMGVSLHHVDEGVNTGAIIARQYVSVPSDATLRSSWDTLASAKEALFFDRWESIVMTEDVGEAQAALAEIGMCRGSKASQDLLTLFPKGWETPVAEVAALGREYRADPAGFEQNYGLRLNPLEAVLPGDGSSQDYNVTLRQARMRCMAHAKPQDRPALEVLEAGPEDKLINWLWVNDPVTRRMFKLNGYIGWSEHCRWYEGMLRNADRMLYIGRVGPERIGNVRFDRIYDAVWEVSVNIGPDWRGQGLGAQLLAGAMSLIRAERQVTRLFSMAKETNVASIMSFHRAGMPVAAVPSDRRGLERFDPASEVYMQTVDEGGR